LYKEARVTDRTGEQFGNYQLLRLLGYGGFADVYLGEQRYASFSSTKRSDKRPTFAVSTNYAPQIGGRAV
jgi:serine/threonine protein kinase